MAGMSKEKVVSQIKNLINTYYIFLGYVQFANYIIKTMNFEDEVKKQREKKKIKPGEKREKTKIQEYKDVKIELNSRVLRRLRNEFDNRLIVIDEVHNIRKTDDNENKKVAINLELLVKSALNMRFLLLSATPMYNSYKEIVWLLNIMNTNDRRGRIEVRDIFKKNGDFKDNGEEILTRKATGYISFVRGENPYTFPYRIYPSEFAKEHTFPAIKYPLYQMNLKKIKHEDKKRVLSLYLTKINDCGNCGKCQYCAYKYIIYNLRNKNLTGSKMEYLCELVDISLNKNCIAGDKNAMSPSGIRIGTPAMVTRGFGKTEFSMIADFLNQLTVIAEEIQMQNENGKLLTEFKKITVKNLLIKEKLQEIKNQVNELAMKFPFYNY
jgi:hypothetical protein